MRIKKKILTYALVMLMIFAAIFTVPDSYAYWSNTSYTDTDTGTATIGNWILTWDSTITYNIGDIVAYNGSFWISTKANNANKAPSLSKPNSNWWEPYTF
ncbi:MAG: hypothetical protein K9L02_02670 [Acholeplasmataceae bacterium]|nr:hypothetical protein [Acholeplasmataceae bacterium]